MDLAKSSKTRLLLRAVHRSPVLSDDEGQLPKACNLERCWHVGACQISQRKRGRAQHIKHINIYIKRTRFYIAYIKRTRFYIKRTSFYIKRTRFYIKRSVFVL